MAGVPPYYRSVAHAGGNGSICPGYHQCAESDLVLVIAPESVQADATVLALEMWNATLVE